MSEDDVVVVGAGVIGCIVARELATDRDVVLVDRDGVAAGATGRSAGLVAPTLFYGDRPDAARCANAFFREFDGTGAFEFTRRDRLDVVTASAAPEATETARRLADEGFPVDYLPAETVERRYPAFDLDGFAGAVEYRDTGWVDPYSLAVALARDAEARGATVASDEPVERLLVADGAVAGVETGAGVRRAGTVVVAAGWRTPDLVGPHLDLPVRPYRTQCVAVEPSTALDDAFPLVRVGSEGLYLRPEHNGDLLVGGGFQASTTPETASERADEAFRTRVAEVVPRLLPGLGEPRLVGGWAGIDGGTPDGRPIIDAPGWRAGATAADGRAGGIEESVPDGLIVATGFNGLGVMASPIAAAAVRELVGGPTAAFSLDPFRFDRFGSGAAEFEVTSTSKL